MKVSHSRELEAGLALARSSGRMVVGDVSHLPHGVAWASSQNDSQVTKE